MHLAIQVAERSLVAWSSWLPGCTYWRALALCKSGLCCMHAHLQHVRQQHGQVTAARDAVMQRPSSLPLLLSSLLQVDLSPAHVDVMLALLFLSFGGRLQMHSSALSDKHKLSSVLGSTVVPCRASLSAAITTCLVSHCYVEVHAHCQTPSCIDSNSGCMPPAQAQQALKASLSCSCSVCSHCTPLTAAAT